MRAMWAALALVMLVGCRAAPPRELTVTFLDVGQGDGAVIETPEGRVVVVDGGGLPGTSEDDGADPGHRVLLPYLRHRGISHVDLMIATHPDEDHVQGLVPVARHLSVGAALVSETTHGGAAGRLRERLRRRGVVVRVARRGDRIGLGAEDYLEMLHPGPTPVPDSRSPANDNGIAFRLRSGGSTILFAADLEAPAEAELLRRGVPLRADLLKVGHHGSRTSTTPAFLAAVAPRVAVVSCGRDNRFGHPAPEVVARLERAGVRLWRTDRDGAVRATRSGGGWRLERVR